ncbi:MAG: pyruvate kinase, partial [Clostridia bacterium]|nr:pyruvate kinase [Clostridia bacterium]
MRKTKIVCTIGPASESEETLIGLCKAGMNVARLNFSHNTHEDHKRRIDLIKKVRQDLNLPIAIMLDTKGPEYRIKTFENGRVILNDGDSFTFTTENIIGNEKRVSVSYEKLTNDLSAGDTILLNNGLLSFKVTEVEGKNIHTTVVCGGELSDRKSMSFPGKVMKQKYLSDQDKEDIRFGIENGVDFIACSFVSNKQDLIDVHDFLETLGANEIELIAKIENQSGFDNIEEICKHCDGIMVARGDMGVEIAYEMLPAIQKKLITKCRMLGKRVITATEMLESMIHNPRPTRAEISDVANAVYDGTSAIMLSGETAAGKYPVQAVESMAKIAETTERNINYKKRFHNAEFETRNTVDAISHAT